MKNPVLLVLFIGISLGGGLAIGIITAPGAWYAALNKPFFNPPNWIFGPVWTVLYILIGIAGWRAWNAVGAGVLTRLWILQMGLNFLWSPLFFAAKMPGAALGIILLLLATILLFIKRARQEERVSALLFLPYAAWVAFATALNGAIFILNPAL